MAMCAQAVFRAGPVEVYITLFGVAPLMCILTGLESRDLRRAQRAAMSGTHGDPHINMAPTGTGDRCQQGHVLDSHLLQTCMAKEYNFTLSAWSLQSQRAALQQ